MTFSQSGFQVPLADHVRACRIGDQMIFLDLRRSKYIGVASPGVAELSAAILGSAEAEGSTENAPRPGHLDEWMRQLRDRHLLAEVTPRRSMRHPHGLPEPATSLSVDDDPSAEVGWRDLFRLWRSTFVASAWLRRHDLAHIATRIEALRKRAVAPEPTPHGDPMQVATARYMRLRPFALSSHDRCLNDSLTLVHFLAGQGLFPRWVIGVRVHPFGAHSWVQSGTVVLNDMPERVRRFEPILIV